MHSSLHHRGVYAVPPVARNQDGSINAEENRRLLRHLCDGGLRRVLYGGNGNLYHMRIRDYEALLEVLDDAAGEATIVPSLGPAYGRAMDQADILRRFRFSVVMALPSCHPRDAAGLDRGYREIAESAGMPLLLYIKSEDDFGRNKEAGLDVVAGLIDDGVSIGVKYAVVRQDPAQDAYLEALLARVDPAFVISGLGERPAVVHMQEWDLPGFTTGSGCVDPSRARTLFERARDGDYDAANDIREHFIPLEDQRDRWGPISVLHAAVEAAGLARLGQPLPFLGPLSEDQRAAISRTVSTMLQ